jgi:hypothetical protein
MAIGRHSNQVVLLQVLHFILARLEDLKTWRHHLPKLDFYICHRKTKKIAETTNLGLAFERGLMFLFWKLK